MERYVAFLRGINMIGRKTTRMETLKNAFESTGFKNVRTIQASGNVIFETAKADHRSLATKIENTLEGKLGYKVGVVLRTITQIRELVESNPFKQIKLTSRTKLLVTFLSEKHNGSFKIPYESPEKDFRIIRVLDCEVYGVVNLLPNKNSSGIMTFLEKRFGKQITTRNWNTLLKLISE